MFVRLGAPDVVAAEVMSAKFCDFSRIEAKNRTTTTALAEGLDERATGTRKVLILRPAFKDDSNDPFPPGREGLLDEVAGFYATNSYHKLMLEFTISPLLPLAESRQQLDGVPECAASRARRSADVFHTQVAACDATSKHTKSSARRITSLHSAAAPVLAV